MKLFEQIVEATVAGDQERCAVLAREVLDSGADPLQAIEQGYTKGMTIVGDKFSRMEYYLPELIRCADAMNAAMDVLKPHLGKDQDSGVQGSGVQGSVVIGTIQGDLHDLGKNIVKTMLQAAGLTVHDLGCDVQVRSFIDKAEELDADVIAASAILTTTMAYMPDLVNLLTDMSLRERFKVMVGGAPVTPEYAKEAGADGYGQNAAEAVDTAKRLVQSKKGGN
jgi:corrinoid protein of di/trimethylamine methyltransferase